MKSGFVRSSAAFAVALVFLHAAGAFAPGISTWGFQQFGYLPRLTLYLYCLLSAVGIVAAYTGRLDSVFDDLSRFMVKKPSVLN